MNRPPHILAQLNHSLFGMRPAPLLSDSRTKHDRLVRLIESGRREPDRSGTFDLDK